MLPESSCTASSATHLGCKIMRTNISSVPVFLADTLTWRVCAGIIEYVGLDWSSVATGIVVPL